MPDSSVESHVSHLSIGEVLGLLLEEFPDITISKIRFLESQGLVAPERTPSGYRKFYDDDVELLRCILREQRENFLPLRVIKDRIDSGEIDPSGEHKRPRGIRNVSHPDDPVLPVAAGAAARDDREVVTGAAALFVRTDHPADPVLAHIPSEVPAHDTPIEHAADARPASAAQPASEQEPAPATLLPGVLLDERELCSMTGLSSAEVADLVSYGVIVPEQSGLLTTYDEDALEIGRLSKRFLDAGVDARHLRGWRVNADREAGLLDQLVQPLLRQRNPASRAHAVEQLVELEAVGGRLRSAMMRSILRHHAH